MPLIRNSSWFMKPVGALLSAFLLYSLSLQPSACQSNYPATPAHTTSVNVNEVSLDVVVRDQKGRLVSDLKPEDLAVTDGGVPVKISSLRLVSAGDREQFISMVFDRMDMAAGRNAREIAAKILNAIPQAGFSFCVLKTGSRLMLYKDFTSDRTALSGAIAQVVSDEASADSGVEEEEKRLMRIARLEAGEIDGQITDDHRLGAQVLLAALQESRRTLEELHTQPGLAGMMALVRAQLRMPRRKVVFYFTSGFVEDSTSQDRFRDIISSANRAGVSIYVVVTNALSPQADQSILAMMAMGSARAAAAQTQAQPAFVIGSDGARQAVPQPPPGLAPMISSQMDRYEMADPERLKDPLTMLTEGTGGAYLSAGENIKKPLQRMVADMSAYYEAAYVSPVENFDGQFRTIAVKPQRAGLKIKSRSGYFALPPSHAEAIRAFEAPLFKTLDETQLPSDVDLHVRMLHLGDMPSGNENAVVVEVPISSLKTKDDANSNLYSLHAAFGIRIKNAAGEVVEHFGEDIPRHGALDAKDAALAGTINVQRHFPAGPGDYTVEVAVFDYESGKTGATRLPFNIPKPSVGPSLSDVAMVGRIDPVPPEADPTDPMRYGNGRIVASALEQVEQGRSELSLFFVVHPDPESSEPPTLEMEVLKSGEPITRVPLALRRTSGPAAVPYLASIQAAGLHGGDYQVVERLSHNGRTAERSLTFHITGKGEPASDTTKGGSGDLGLSTTAQVDGPTGRTLTIKSLPSTDVPRPSAEQLGAIISQARKRALAYGKALPNFMCVEVTNRSVDQTGNGNWKRRDSLAELLTYHDNAESRTTLEVNGVRSSLKRTEMNSTWPISVGEFGAALNLVFNPTSKAIFEWKEAASLGDGSGTVQVLNYRVARENATIVLRHGGDEVGVGFHGLIYVDATTGSVRRATIQADGLPRNFPYHSAAMTVDYDYVTIASRDYLLPVRSTVRVQRGRKQVELNEISFRNYRRFSSRTKIKVLQ